MSPEKVFGVAPSVKSQWAAICYTPKKGKCQFSGRISIAEGQKLLGLKESIPYSVDVENGRRPSRRHHIARTNLMRKRGRRSFRLEEELP
ncbi:unnamed protein product [Caenorhabditis auriculariae]|uniref:Uncharacterized protein n=1 Tax=Caenorhabditis auriculariae TaxID=2777116 RepID=A0A8S1H6S2_9PELO|nr:unnamed protein product [Caenorhabditis auriculariae]